jgi:hypothetical protein
MVDVRRKEAAWMGCFAWSGRGSPTLSAVENSYQAPAATSKPPATVEL